MRFSPGCTNDATSEMIRRFRRRSGAKQTPLACLRKAAHQKFILRSERDVGGFSAPPASQSAAALGVQRRDGRPLQDRPAQPQPKKNHNSHFGRHFKNAPFCSQTFFFTAWDNVPDRGDECHRQRLPFSSLASPRQP